MCSGSFNEEFCLLVLNRIMGNESTLQIFDFPHYWSYVLLLKVGLCFFIHSNACFLGFSVKYFVSLWWIGLWPWNESSVGDIWFSSLLKFHSVIKGWIMFLDTFKFMHETLELYAHTPRTLLSCGNHWSSCFNLIMQAGKTLSERRWKAAFSPEGHLEMSRMLSRIQRGVSSSLWL